RGAPIHDVDGFWAHRAKYGYAAVAHLQQETWIEPFWAGPRTYGYEWILLDDSKKRSAWLDHKDPPRSSVDLADSFARWKASRV
ncbi:MAG TPA: hypothetical protein VI541_02430, partial [Actinomycetota bacterium]|nr:hypothetical protein [Actinomycetota bacterium]